MGININNLPKGMPQKKAQEVSSGFNTDWLIKKPVFESKMLKTKHKEFFFSELKILLSSGVDLKSSLEIIVEEQTKPEFKELFSGIYNKVIEGVSLSEVINQTGRFTEYDYYSLKIGEESGNVIRVLDELHQYYKNLNTQKRKVTSALTYPIIVLVTAVGAIFFIMKFMVPMFIEIFMRANYNLPAITRFIIKISDHITSYMVIFLLLITGILITDRIMRKQHNYRLKKNRLVLKIPVVGKMVRLFYLSRLFQSMSLMTSSDVNLLTSIELTGKMVNFPLIEDFLKTVYASLVKGKPLHQCIGQSDLFDRRTVYLVKVGEEVNQLDTVFKQLFEQHSEELNYQLGILTNLLEPILIMVVGGLVAFILVAMYLPMFQLGSTIV
jgi:type IV pilus assembly protein PilC